MKTLIIIDVQNDFTPGGPLEVPNGNQIIPIINQIQDKFDLVIATQDWHPEGHMSFASSHSNKKPFDQIDWQGGEQVLWPDHCVQGSKGAEFHRDLSTKRIEAIFRKGMDKKIDSYSGFYDNGHKKNTGLSGYLRERDADELYFCGLAADVCVYFSIKDSLNEGFKTTLIEDATKAIDDGGFEDLRKEILDKGCEIIDSSNL